MLAEARQAAVETDPARGLERLLRRAVQLLSDDPAFAAVLATPTCVCEATMQRGAELGSSIATVLERASRAGLVRRDVTADDLRRLICGLEYALRAGPRDDAKPDVYPASAPRRARIPGPNLDSYWSEWVQRARAQVATEAGVRFEYGLQWLVLGVPRLHYTVATLDVTSKTGAGRYALEIVPPKWHVVVRAAMALRADRQAPLPAPPDVLWRDALDLSAWLIEDAHRLVEAPR